MYKHILVCSDNSAAAKTAFITAHRLAEQLGATLTVVHVADPVRETVPPTVPSWCKELPGDVPVPLTTTMRWDLVVMGTKAREGLRALLGSVAEDALKHSDVPVLVVRERKA